MLDTDICIHAVNQTSRSVLSHISVHLGQCCMSSIVLAELLFGAEKAARTEENVAVALAFSTIVRVVDFDGEAARHYAQIRGDLERRGTPIGGNDMLIAAHARSLDLTLVTNNRREFDRIPGLRVENWV